MKRDPKILAAVVNLQACQAGHLEGATGRAVHGFWFSQWERLAPAVADRLHQPNQVQPFTLSPLLGLPHPRKGKRETTPGTPAWFRVTTLQEELSRRLEEVWLPGLPPQVTLSGLRWRVTGYTTATEEHPWAGRADPQALAEAHLLRRDPPACWRLEFATPTAFHGGGGHLPFPLPDALVRSWLRRWQALGPVRLPEDMPERARRGLMVSAYTLKTVPWRDSRRVVIGCVGWMTLRASGLRKGEQAALDLLAAYAFYAGSGHHTTQGMGMTRRR